MYSLIVAGADDAWEGRRFALTLDRLGEHTADELKNEYCSLDPRSIEKLLGLPTLFAYEQSNDLPARLGWVTKIYRSSRREVRFDFRLRDDVQPISADTLSNISSELDISAWELNRTHWAVKDVELIEILNELGLAGSQQTGSSTAVPLTEPSSGRQLVVTPMVFTVPRLERDPGLVAVMMPFLGREDVYDLIRDSAAEIGLHAKRADEMFEESIIVQDIVNLIYASEVVIADLSGLNPNVMYELGIAHTIGRIVIPIAESLHGLPFDVSHHRVIGFLRNQEGLRDLQAKLTRKLRQCIS